MWGVPTEKSEEPKFEDWKCHETDPAKKGLPVTTQEKTDRAEEIAKKLGDNKYWHSHGRHISIATVRSELRLKVEDYSTNDKLRDLIRDYNDILVDHIRRNGYSFFLHSKNFF